MAKELDKEVEEEVEEVEAEEEEVEEEVKEEEPEYPSEEWIKTLAPTDSWNERHLMAALALFGMPSSYLDIGCGTGVMVNLLRRLGCDKAYGVDAIERPEDSSTYREWLFAQDLTEPFSLSEKTGISLCKLITCIEVAEHLPPESDIIIADTCANHVGRTGYLIFTSAHPGQGGDDHIGERPAHHWRSLLDARGLSYQKELSVELAMLWSNIKSPLYWLAANVQVFDR